VDDFIFLDLFHTDNKVLISRSVSIDQKKGSLSREVVLLKFSCLEVVLEFFFLHHHLLQKLFFPVHHYLWPLVSIGSSPCAPGLGSWTSPRDAHVLMHARTRVHSFAVAVVPYLIEVMDASEMCFGYMDTQRGTSKKKKSIQEAALALSSSRFCACKFM
jgi:hypothetical protein